MNDWYINILKRIGNTNNIFLKGFCTFCLSKQFFNAFYSNIEIDSNFSNIISISFDCDHHKDIESLPYLIEMLSSYDIRASFACIGKLIENYPSEHLMILEDHHEIINHTYTHPFNDELNSNKNFNELTKNEQIYEIDKCHKVCKEILEYEPVGFRIPHFSVLFTEEIYEILTELNYIYSSSILAFKSRTGGLPYTRKGIIEFPIITCPDHPFQAFDTYHAFRSNLTSHKINDFCQTFERLIEFTTNKGMYTNLYFDPQDFKENKLDNIFEIIAGKKITVKKYKDIIMELKK